MDAVEAKTITNTEIIGVISNNKNAYALERAKKHGIPAMCISPKDYESKGKHLTMLSLMSFQQLNPDLNRACGISCGDSGKGDQTVRTSHDQYSPNL